MKQVLVIQTAFIGDVILATALLESLHQHYPNTALDLVVRKGSESLFAHHPFLRQVIVWDKQRRKYHNWWQLFKLIRRQRYDAVINLQRFAATGLWTAFSGAQWTSGFDKNPFSFLFSHRARHRFDGLHEIERNHMLIYPLVGESKPSGPRLYPTANDFRAIRHYSQQQPYICISPASVWPTKQLPAEQWIRFIQQLPNKYVVYLLGAANDYPLNEHIRQACPMHKVYNLAGKLSLLQSAALMQTAHMNYANDSAPLHLGSAMNAPVTAIYCSTVPRFGFYPLSQKAYIVETPEALSCRPCGKHGRRACPKKHFLCATSIQTQQLLACLAEKSVAPSTEKNSDKSY